MPLSGAGDARTRRLRVGPQVGPRLGLAIANPSVDVIYGG